MTRSTRDVIKFVYCVKRQDYFRNKAMLKVLAGRIIVGIKNFFTKFFCFLIRAYQICISPLLGKNCRFTPTCSAYALEAIKKYGPGKGLLLSIKRVLKCNPFHEGGYDPVP